MAGVVLSILWIVLVVAGAVWADLRGSAEPQSGMKVVRGVPQNTLLLPGPAVPDALAMRYVLTERGVAAGGVVHAEDVGRWPTLPPLAAAQYLVAAPIAMAEVVGGLNAGSKAVLCDSGTKPAPVFELLAVTCDGAVPMWRCQGIVRLTTAQQDVIVALGKSGSTAHFAQSC